MVTLFWSLGSACVVFDVKQIVAYSTVSQLCYMFLGLFLGISWVGFHILVHALFKSVLFMLGGVYIHNS